MGYIAVIGAGSWGTTLANLLGEKSYDVTLWAYEQELVDEICRTNINGTYLPGIPLSLNVNVTSSLQDALKKARYILNVVPTQFVRRVFADAAGYIRDDAIIINASKGIEQGTLKTVSAIFTELTGREAAVLSGPSFADEVIKKMPTAVTLASKDREDGLILQDVFNTDYFRVYTNEDVIGVEIGGALKNVLAIASGISDGLGLGASARAALITRGLAEMVRLGCAMGAEEKTFSGLSGIGDLVLTCTGTLSRNYTVGFKLGSGVKLQEILDGMKTVAEGVATSQSAYELSGIYGVDMPIVQQIYKVVNEGKDPHTAVKELMTRSLKSEY
ncbi:MAG: NAD(P)-dependent glycerol-3-phosphate dehydrogenase [Nitrospira sp.]|nr:NAD(P)-dependent glycerol-3-phosphate dehydrogenase [bacterium]MBL7049879.1 NAD(P)-dependent glycerol-3-phosphate dehydrogenase [Nitrospira sp.]